MSCSFDNDIIKCVCEEISNYLWNTEYLISSPSLIAFYLFHYIL